MQALLDAAIDLAALVSPQKAKFVASALRGLSSPESAPAPSKLVDTPAARAALTRVLAAWSGQNQTSGDEIAGMLHGASEAHRRVESELSVELVWTGPTTHMVPVRRTEQVLLDLIGKAKEDLFLVSFVAYEVPSVAAALNEASARGVQIRMLLEASREKGGSLDIDPAAKMRTQVPDARIFTWKARIEPFVNGKVHAKIAVADRNQAFITSANLTGHALSKNIEAGVLIRGGMVPRTLREHLGSLIDVGVISKPSE